MKNRGKIREQGTKKSKAAHSQRTHVRKPSRSPSPHAQSTLISPSTTNHRVIPGKLQETEEPSRSSVQNLESITFRRHMDFTPIFFRGAIEAITGYTEDELMSGKPRWDQVIHPEDLPKILQDKVRAVSGHSSQREYRIIRKGGDVRWIRELIRNIKDSSRKPALVEGVLYDITERKQAEETFSTAFRLNPNPMSISTLAEGRYTDVNDGFINVTGYQRDEIIGHTSTELGIWAKPDDRSRLEQALREQGKVHNLEIRFCMKSGEERLGSVSAEIIGIGGRQFILSNITDITDRRKAEEALIQSEERYRTILDEIDEGYYEVDLAGNYTFVNEATCRRLGYSKEELIGMNYRVYMPEQNVKSAYKTWNKVYRTGEIVKSHPVTFTRKDGTQIFVDVSISPLRNKAGEIIGFRSVSRDITERRQAEEALRESEEKFRSLAEQSPNMIFINKKGRVVYANKRCETLTGYSREEFYAHDFNFVNLHAPEFRSLVKEDFSRHIKGEDIPPIEYALITKDGRRVDAILQTKLIEYEKERAILGTVTDITERKRAEEALRQSEERYRTILDEMDESYYEVDLTGNVTFVNDAMCRRTGYTREELLGTNFRDYSAEEDTETTFNTFNEVYRTGKPARGIPSYKIVAKDGTERFTEISAFPLQNKAGEIIGFRGIGRNVTERRRAEEALRQSEERYRTMLDEMDDGYYEVDLAGNFTLVNDAICRHLGYTREELLGANYRVYSAAEDTEVLFNAFNTAYITGEPERGILAKLVGKDGKARFGEISAFPLQNKAGEIIGFRGIGRDVTERRRAEEALRQSEERYRTILDEMEEAYYELDLAGNYTFVNDSFCQTSLYSKEELIGMNYQTLVSQDDHQTAYRKFNSVYRTGTPVRSIPIKSIRKGGTTHFVELSASPLKNAEGNTIGFRGISHDVTDRKKAEEERKELEQKAQLASRLASVGEMASGIAHEINNPLTSVIGYSQLLLQRKDISREARKDLGNINEGAQRVAGIIKRLLTFARQQKPHREYVNINEIINTTLALRTYHLETNNIKVVTQFDPDLPITIADGSQLQQVFLNLIVNAETAMKLAHGKGKLTVNTESVNSTIKISFKDNGPGIPKKSIDRIFDPFFTTREVGQGTGLGLSVCHGIITEHDGRIYAQSQLGKGATFIVELPIVTEAEQLKLAEPTAEEPKKMAKANILVVDDEPMVRQLLTEVLTEEGHEVEVVDNANDALEMISNRRYSLILLDIKMPGMTGIELYERIQKIARSLARRIVFITGDVLGADTQEFLAKTNALYINKPFDIKKLKKEISHILAQGE